MNGIEPGFDTQASGAQLPDSYRTCVLIYHVINANTLTQHVRFLELSSGFDSSSRGVVVFFYNRAVVMEKAA